MKCLPYITSIREDLAQHDTFEGFQQAACISLIPGGSPGAQAVIFRTMRKHPEFEQLAGEAEQKFPGAVEFLFEQVRGAETAAVSARSTAVQAAKRLARGTAH